jgi:hypothetical protein
MSRVILIVRSVKPSTFVLCKFDLSDICMLYGYMSTLTLYGIYYWAFDLYAFEWQPVMLRNYGVVLFECDAGYNLGRLFRSWLFLLRSLPV